MAGNYASQLTDPRWQKLRLEILSRDEWACTACSATDKELHVHHLRYVTGKQVWEYEDSDLVTLCRPCHAERTRVTREARQYMYEMLEHDTESALDWLREGAFILFLGMDCTEALLESMRQISRGAMAGASQKSINAAVIRLLHSVTDIAMEAERGKNQNG